MNYKINQMSVVTPREKMMEFGARALSDAELLSIILQTGIKGKNVYVLAKELDVYLKTVDNATTYKPLKEAVGMGDVKTMKVLACLEFSRRRTGANCTKVESASDIFKIVHDITDKSQEYFVLLTINGASQLIKKRTLFIGTLNRSMVHPREIFSYALRDRANCIIICHNHPSGKLEPSEEDIKITRRLKEIGELMDIQLIDHVIVTRNDFFSFSCSSLVF